MEKVYEGKTKTVFKSENGNFLLKFKDDVTGKDGVFDPGENQVGLTIEGSGNAALSLTKFFFDILKEEGIKTHYVSADLSDNTMEVIPASAFGKGVECIYRYKAVGSFYRRFNQYVENGQDLNGFFEMTLKNDEAGDPVVSEEELELFSIMTKDEYKQVREQTKKICDIVKKTLADRGFDLYDIKLEFGRDKNNGEIILIDEISGGNMRVYKDGEYVPPIELTNEILKTV